jgi:membrane protease YdiL (CAAX protease family)
MQVDQNLCTSSHYYKTTLGNYCNPVLNTLTQTIAPVIKKCFYEHSIFYAFDNQAIANKFQKNKDLSCTQKFKIGVIKGSEKAMIGIFVANCLALALNGMPSGKAATFEGPSMLEALAAAVDEEILFRGVLQNCLAGSQKIATYVTPQCLQNNRAFKWLTSPSARIISANMIFAATHLSNGGGYLSDKYSYIQVIRIMLLPSYGIIHETTGNIITPIACHMTNNFFATLLS